VAQSRPAKNPEPNGIAGAGVLAADGCSSTESLLALDPIERAKHAAHLMDRHRSAISQLAMLRSEALVEARSAGSSANDIAKQLMITRQQVHRLLGETEIHSPDSSEKLSIDDLLEMLEALGWNYEASSGTGYIEARCPCGDHVSFIRAEPSNSAYFKNMAGRLGGLCGVSGGAQ